MDRYKTLIFDLGNVIISFSHDKMYTQVARLCEMNVDTIKDLFEESRIGMQYERGLVSSEEIISFLSEKSGKTLDYSEVMGAGSDIFTPRHEMVDLLKALKKKGYRLILLSNTNEAHYEFINREYSFFNLFDHLILSYEVGAVKPESAIYEHALKHASCSPHECYYIDDIPEYIEAAAMLGIRGHTFTSPSHLYHELHEEGILP